MNDKPRCAYCDLLFSNKPIYQMYSQDLPYCSPVCAEKGLDEVIELQTQEMFNEKP